jgi:hypothetical protein
MLGRDDFVQRSAGYGQPRDYSTPGGVVPWR